MKRLRSLVTDELTLEKQALSDRNLKTPDKYCEE
jgi:hypothetical protein